MVSTINLTHYASDKCSPDWWAVKSFAIGIIIFESSLYDVSALCSNASDLCENANKYEMFYVYFWNSNYSMCLNGI